MVISTWRTKKCFGVINGFGGLSPLSCINDDTSLGQKQLIQWRQ